MKLKINPYDQQSITDALNWVNAYKLKLADRQAQLLRRLSEIGLSVAQIKFNTAAYDGTNDVSVTVTNDGTRAVITASGKAVCFIEFGAGVALGYGYPSEFKPSGISEIGTYGKGKGSNPSGWYYGKGLHTLGNPPAKAMLGARDTMIEQVTQIAREVFND